MTDSAKVNAKHLSKGHAILVVDDGAGGIKPARTKTGSSVATVARKPVRTDSPEPGRRGGYRIQTNLGTIPFVTAVAGIMRADEGDTRRHERIEADRRRAMDDSQGVLDGLVMSPAEPPPAAPSAAPPPARRTRQRRPAPTPPTAAPVAARAPSVRATPAVARTPEGGRALENFRAMARASTTERARAYWQAKADGAAFKVAT